MLIHADYRQLVVKLRPPRGTRAVRRPRFKESWDTMILGGLSTAIGVGLLIVLALAVAKWPIAGWNERANSIADYYVPNGGCAIGALVGACLGLSGTALARHGHGTISPLSIVGTVVSLLHVCLFFAYVLWKELR
jgi:hypothetical protein